MTLLAHLGHVEVPDVVRELEAAGTLGALVCDASRIYEANDAFLRLVGFTRAELEAGELSWLRMTTPGWMAADARAIGQLRATGRADVYEKEFARADGSIVRERLSDVLLEVEPLRIFALVADAGDPAQAGAADALDAASRSVERPRSD
jgi:PAS domain S-box-containing protein